MDSQYPYKYDMICSRSDPAGNYNYVFLSGVIVGFKFLEGGNCLILQTHEKCSTISHVSCITCTLFRSQTKQIAFKIKYCYSSVRVYLWLVFVFLNKCKCVDCPVCMKDEAWSVLMCACLFLSAHSLLYLHVCICRHVSRDNDNNTPFMNAWG